MHSIFLVVFCYFIFQFADNLNSAKYFHCLKQPVESLSRSLSDVVYINNFEISSVVCNSTQPCLRSLAFKYAFLCKIRNPETINSSTLDNDQRIRTALKRNIRCLLTAYRFIKKVLKIRTNRTLSRKIWLSQRWHISHYLFHYKDS